MSKYKMPSTEFLTLTAEDFDNGAIKDAIWEGLRNGELLQTKLDKANEKIDKLRKHNSECTMPRFSALGCTCGLFKKVKPRKR